MAVRLRWGAGTDVGRVRSKNEDSNLVNDRVMAVADGMGGHRGGAVASQVALETLNAGFTQPSSDALIAAAYRANDAVFERSNDDPDLRGMGTTLVAVAPITSGEKDDTDDTDDRVDDAAPARDDSNANAPDHDLIAWVHVGDSRIYLFRDGELQQLTEDHSLVEQWVREGTLSAEEARSHPQRNILTRALGIGSQVGIDAGTVIPYAGDRFVLCSDGLFNEVDEPRIESTLRRLDDPDDAAHELVRLAVENGGRDNVTVVIVDVVDDDQAALSAATGIHSTTVEGHAETAGATAAAGAGAGVAGEAAPPKPKRLTRKERRARKRSRPRPRRLTWRVVLFTLLFLAVLGAAVGVIGYQARHTYYVGFNGDSVVIFKGKPGGMLWFDPTVERDTGLTRAQVPASETDRLNRGQEEGSLASAETYVQSLRDRANPSTTTTSTTNPLAPPTTPTVAPTSTSTT